MSESYCPEELWAACKWVLAVLVGIDLKLSHWLTGKRLIVNKKWMILTYCLYCFGVFSSWSPSRTVYFWCSWHRTSLDEGWNCCPHILLRIIFQCMWSVVVLPGECSRQWANANEADAAQTSIYLFSPSWQCSRRTWGSSHHSTSPGQAGGLAVRGSVAHYQCWDHPGLW